MKEEIISKNHSLCYSCEHARKPASDVNQDNGWVGCAEFARKEHYDFVEEADELGEGWVDLKTRIFGNKSGITTNCQLLAKMVSKCKSYQKLS